MASSARPEVTRSRGDWEEAASERAVRHRETQIRMSAKPDFRCVIRLWHHFNVSAIHKRLAIGGGKSHDGIFGKPSADFHTRKILQGDFHFAALEFSLYDF